MKIYRMIKSAAAVFGCIAAVSAIHSCSSDKAEISGILTGKPETEVVVKLLNVNRYQTLDTLRTDASGAYRYSVNVSKGQPEFVYVFYGDTKVASLLLQQGDRVKVVSDTLGRYSVEGSEESAMLQETEKAFAEFLADFNSAAAGLEGIDESSEEGKAIRAELSRKYVAYYRDRVKYVMNNSHSLTVVPVLFQQINEDFPIFSQTTDALTFRSISDSLKSSWPESKYSKVLENEADRRIRQMDLEVKIRNAEEAFYPDIELPDLKGEKKRLSDMEAKVLMIYFWSTTDAVQKMFNLDSMLPVYEEFHPRGLEIFAVSLDTDKAAWASAVRSQNMPWINVCDIRGASSPHVLQYNVQSLPTAVFIVDGQIAMDSGVTDAASMKKFLAKILK